MFISRDPIGLLGGVNVFAYEPNPIHWVDVLGLSKKDCASSCSKTKEKIVETNSFEDARNRAIKRLDEKGFDWTSRENHIGRLGMGKDQRVGFLGKTKDGDFARYRLDYDPQKGTHINLEIGKGKLAEKIAYTFKGDEKIFQKLLRNNQ